MSIYLLIMSTNILTMAIHLLTMLIHLLTIPNFSTNSTTKFYVCANTLNDRVNISIDSIDNLNSSSSDLCFPNPSLLMLLFKDLLIICSSTINIVLTVGSSICSSSSLLHISGFYMSQSSSSTSILKSFT